MVIIDIFSAAHWSNIIACYVHYADTRGVTEIRGKVLEINYC